MLKKIIAWLHLWLGLVSGIMVIFLGITGCILTFETEIKSFSYPWLHVEKPVDGVILPPSELYKAVEKAIPGKEIRSVWYYGAERTAQFTIDSDSLIYVNPYTAEVVAMVDHEDFFDFIDEGHRNLWMPDSVGPAIIGWATFIFFLILITGIVLWWPKRWNKAGKQKAFKIKWKARFKRINYDLHNVLGFYSLLIAVLMAITGLIMSFAWFSSGVYWLSGGGILPAYSVAPSDTTNVPQVNMLAQVDKAWYKVINEIGEYNPDQVILSFPDEPTEAIYACTDMHRGIWRDLYFDQYTLDLLPSSQTKFEDANFAVQLRRSNFSLHVGAIGGLTTKIIFFIASLISASLPITGFYIWYERKRKAGKKKKKNLAKAQLVVS